MTVGENEMPLPLFVLCVALDVTHFPCAMSLSYALSAQAPTRNFGFLFCKSLPMRLWPFHRGPPYGWNRK